ncbi:hypothetical protein M3Y94_01219400 [Aphelenchoides besseyi]|nr:hypothetical protein M3Y94_01219400 [Aphelenchoides besseyi]
MKSSQVIWLFGILISISIASVLSINSTSSINSTTSSSTTSSTTHQLSTKSPSNYRSHEFQKIAIIVAISIFALMVVAFAVYLTWLSCNNRISAAAYGVLPNSGSVLEAMAYEQSQGKRKEAERQQATKKDGLKLSTIFKNRLEGDREERRKKQDDDAPPSLVPLPRPRPNNRSRSEKKIVRKKKLIQQNNTKKTKPKSFTSSTKSMSSMKTNESKKGKTLARDMIRGSSKKEIGNKKK